MRRIEKLTLALTIFSAIIIGIDCHSSLSGVRSFQKTISDAFSNVTEQKGLLALSEKSHSFFYVICNEIEHNQLTDFKCYVTVEIPTPSSGVFSNKTCSYQILNHRDSEFFFFSAMTRIFWTMKIFWWDRRLKNSILWSRQCTLSEWPTVVSPNWYCQMFL